MCKKVPQHITKLNLFLRFCIYLLTPSLPEMSPKDQRCIYEDVAQSPVIHDHLSKVILVVEKDLVLIYCMAAGWRVYLTLVGKGLIMLL